MRDAEKTRKQLIEELLELRRQNIALRNFQESSTSHDLLQTRFRLAHFALSHSMDELLQATLDEVEGITGSSIGFYHFLGEDQKTLSLQAWSTNTLKNMCGASGKDLHYNVEEAGVWVDCVRKRRPVIHNDYPALTHRKSLPPGHADVVREVVVPVFRGNSIVAILGVGNKPCEYDARDVENVSCLADLAWDLVEKKRAVEALVQSEEQYRSVVENVGVGIAMISSNMEILSLNKQMMEWFPHINVMDRPLCYKVYNTPPGETVCSWCPTLLTLRDGQVHECVTDTPSQSGTLHYRIISSPVRDSAGKVVAAVEMVDDITERMTIEEALKKSEVSLREAQHMAHIGDWEWEIETGKVHWSEELYRIYGFEPNEISPDYGIVVDAMHPGSREEFLNAIAAALKGQRPFELDYTFFRKDGSVAVLHTIGKVICNSSGSPERMVGTVQDISEQKAAQEALRESENKFRSIFDKANDGILIANVSTKKFILANATICEMLGYTVEEMAGMDIEDIHPPDDLPGILEKFSKQARGEKTVEGNLPVLRKDGSIFYADIGASVLTIGGERCAIGIFRDITDRMKMENALQDSRRFIDRILDTVDEAFIVVDKDYRIVLANSAYGKQVNMPIGDIIGRHCHEISHRSSLPCQERGEDCAVRNSFDKGQPHECVHKHYDKDGGTLYVNTKSYPLKDGTGEVTSVIEVINNITDKHLLEEQILRTQKLEAVGLLAGGIAHDFNNLLLGIFGSVSMAKTLSEKGGKTYQMLEVAETALDEAKNLTKQLLTFSKGGEPVKNVFHIPRVVHNSAKFALSGSTVNYVFSPDGDLWPVEADEGQIKQALHNIILNAVEAMPGGGTLGIEARNVNAEAEDGVPLSPGKYVCLVISDTGTGIPESYLSKIFDPYFSTKQRGSGLGLTTSYSIMKKHGGAIEARSELGAGTTFSVYIPASDEEMLPERTGKDTYIRGRGKVLLLDDEEVVRTVADYMLRDLGYDAEFAGNGEEAVEKYEEAMRKGRPFKVVILDLTVRGGIGGKDTLKRLRDMDPGVRAVVSSGYSEDSVLSNYREYGFKAVLSKPYAIEELGSVLRSVLEPGD